MFPVEVGQKKWGISHVTLSKNVRLAKEYCFDTCLSMQIQESMLVRIAGHLWVILSILAHLAHLAQSFFSLILSSINTYSCSWFNPTNRSQWLKATAWWKMANAYDFFRHGDSRYYWKWLNKCCGVTILLRTARQGHTTLNHTLPYPMLTNTHRQSQLRHHQCAFFHF